MIAFRSNKYLKLIYCSSICVGIRIHVEHTQQPLVKAASYRKIVTSTESFNSSYKNISGSFSGKASSGFGLFSGDVSAAFNHVTSNVSYMKTLNYMEESSTTEFNPNFLQIIREVTTEAEIDGNVAKIVETKIVDSVLTDNPLTQKQLQEKSEEYIKMYDNGSGTGIRLGSICSFSAYGKREVEEEGALFSNYNSFSKYSCNILILYKALVILHFVVDYFRFEICTF